MDYICVDLWNKRCGIAASSEGIAFARDVVIRSNLITYLKKYFSQNTWVETIIVGLPHDLYGKDHTQLERTENFMGKLSSIFPDKEIIWHDERFSSYVASEWHDDHRDDIAAQVILQSYLDSITNKK